MHEALSCQAARYMHARYTLLLDAAGWEVSLGLCVHESVRVPKRGHPLEATPVAETTTLQSCPLSRLYLPHAGVLREADAVKTRTAFWLSEPKRSVLTHTPTAQAS